MSSSPLRALREDDADAVARLFREAYGAARPIDAGEVRQWLSSGLVAGDDACVLELDGQVVGYGDLSFAEYVELDVAAPGHWDVFLDWAEARTRDSSCTMLRAGFPVGHELEHVLVARGYRYWRSSLHMYIELGERPEAAIREGFELRTYSDADHDALIAAVNEAFARDPAFRRLTPPFFRTAYLDFRGFDPDLWFLAWDGDQLAGLVLAAPEYEGDAALGWIRLLAVREPWRGRGLGSGLLRLGFAALYDRGLRRVGLGVDAENVTGAVRLYERAGMQRALRQDSWVKDV
jgi:ribosomal protein S18 acetylase RimI-like enzyme